MRAKKKHFEGLTLSLLNTAKKFLRRLMYEDFKLPVVSLHYHIFIPDSKIAEKWDWDEPSRVRGSYFLKREISRRFAV